ncbi:alpha/beta hydrolase [Aquimarina sp. TRL1]|uniref:alpha/beta hydrolase n=1 Tax=Aquimarina sp. (strain TRL1) TaxID=2736252 RepID=UPI0015882ABA|nr:alpha/beta hydrolase [Aquimarina sp. TRL1]QKX07042.1 alpha/beta hydrolase [Aquimarina sp. TRL1]
MRYIFHIIFYFFISCDSGESQNESFIENKEITIQYKQLPEEDPNLLSLDIYYTTAVSEKKPVVIYVHGGGWSLGDKRNQLKNKIALFRSLGYVFVSINYRLSPFPFNITNPDRIKYPTHNRDLADAIVWTYHKIGVYGGDKNNIVLIGHSAGAHLVALTAINQHFITESGGNPAMIKGVAVIDTEGYDVGEQVKNGVLKKMYLNAFGGDEQLYKEASPLHMIKKENRHPRFFIAKRGNSSRLEIADKFINRLQSNGITVDQVDGSIYDHERINTAIGAAGEEVITKPLTLFLSSCFE